MLLVRPHANNGVWCCTLIPIALWSSLITYENPTNLKTVNLKTVSLILSCMMAFLSLLVAHRLIYVPKSEGKGLLSHFLLVAISDLFERSTSREARLQRKPKPQEITTNDEQNNSSSLTWVTVIIISSTLVLWLIGATASVICIATGCLCLFPKFLHHIFTTFPNSFTFGEGCIAVQAFLLCVFECASSLIIGSDDPSTIEGSFAIIAKAGLLSCLLLCFMPLVPGFQWIGKNTTFCASGMFILCGVTIPYLWTALKRNPVLWVLELIISCKIRTSLMASWIVCVAFAVVVVKSQTERGQKASTRVRKLFHGLVVVVYTSGIILDVNFTYLASIVALCVFVLLESFRIHDIEPFSSCLTKSFDIFLDEKDQGKLILTHMYLLVGCSLPLWIAHDFRTNVLTVKLLSGVLATGIGDSAASIFGSKFGNIKFPDSQKTVEGTVAAAMSQLLYVWLLQKVGLVAMQDWTGLYMPIFIVSLAEALTNQVDNLVLPLILYSGL